MSNPRICVLPHGWLRNTYNRHGMNKSKILFIDFDGVLHPVSATRWFDLQLPIEESIERGKLFRWTWLLADILQPYPEVAIVVHSTWRLLKSDTELKCFLGPLGARYAGSTPRAQRYESIEWVLQQNSLSDYRILDDHPEEFPLGIAELIICDSELGVYDRSVRAQLLAWLESKEQ